MSDTYDVVIVGAGVAGALAASELSKQGRRVLVLESGPPIGYQDDHVNKFYAANAKTPNAPWPGASPSNKSSDEFAPRPSVLDSEGPKLAPADDPTVKPVPFDSNKWYLIQTGDYPFNSTYERVGGGTSNHWLGTCLRHVPNDFKLHSTYGVDGARDWPITYDDLEPWYLKAEREIGVSGNSEAFANFGGAKRSAPFPMDEIPPTYLDRQFAEGLNGETINGETVTIQNTPQGRNSREYPTEDDARAFGLYNPGNLFKRSRCMGNTSCIPICPILAKWDANSTLRQATAASRSPDFPKKTAAEVRYRSVAYKVVIGENDNVSEILYKDYSDPGDIKERVASGTIFVLAAHAIETAKLLLLSEWKDGTTVANTSGQVGCNLMDHSVLAVWGLTDEPLYPFRAPLATAGIPNYRDTAKRSDRAAYRIEIHNDGWRWPDAAPGRTVWEIMNLDTDPATLAQPPDLRGIEMIKDFFARPKRAPLRGGGKWYGKDLRQQLEAVVVRQVVLAGEPEALPLPTSRVTLADDETLVDGLGLRRPQAHYEIADYSKEGFVEAEDTLTQVLRKLGATRIDTTVSGNPDTANHFEYQGKKYQYAGAGHIAGTYRMGRKDEQAETVVDPECRSHDHGNLFLLGSGVFPSLGTANPTLTIAALAIRAADSIGRQLDG